MRNRSASYRTVRRCVDRPDRCSLAPSTRPSRPSCVRLEQADFGVFLRRLWLPVRGSRLQGWKRRTGRAQGRYIGTKNVHFAQPCCHMPHRSSHKGPQNTPKSGCNASVALAHTCTPLSRHKHLRTTCRLKPTSKKTWR